ncbi:DUF805 domain-containing protein [Ferrovibrio terrae]|uniref:DUF805 domain-containing protein n=1 Tax=Ferrovibrio terrae TaxID=2594003 RepID=A0A516GXL4_9PROT|nr:DUF805 domain-containing protein [Ferrovibrio terrae]QDO96242.1 DUF805 domain-containing protein [Ferrovibrio terrae]
MSTAWDDLKGWLSQRRSRISFLRFYVGVLLVLIPIGIVAALLKHNWLFGPVVWLFNIVAFIAFLLSIGAMVQRCHDFSYPGWVVLGWLALDGAISIAAETSWGITGNWLVLWVILGWLFTFALLFIPGTRGPNRYGPDSRDQSVIVEPTVWKP